MPSNRSTLLNAVVGGVVSIVLSFTAVSPLLGGAVAGYLEREDGLTVGLLAGLVAALPFAGFLLLVGFVLGVAGSPLEMGLVLLLFVLLALVYTVGLSAVGGVLGVYLFEEYGDDLPV